MHSSVLSPQRLPHCRGKTPAPPTGGAQLVQPLLTPLALPLPNATSSPASQPLSMPHPILHAASLSLTRSSLLPDPRVPEDPGLFLIVAHSFSPLEH